MTWVVKLGGSLADSHDLLAWLEVLACDGGGRVIVVPGGGRFADAVRRAQANWDFPDRTAHHMALLAMEQYGLMLTGLEPRLLPVDTESALYAALRRKRTPVWLPAAMVMRRSDIAASWHLTSDSLAAWLAGRLAASRVVLVKSAAVPSPGVTVEDLSRTGVVDSEFNYYVAQAGCEVWYMSADDHRLLAQAVKGDGACGTRIATASATDNAVIC